MIRSRFNRFLFACLLLATLAAPPLTAAFSAVDVAPPPVAIACNGGGSDGGCGG